MKLPLDNVDKAILAMLQEDGSLSISELSDRLGMTPPPVWRRVRRLKNEGVLERQVWTVNAEAVGVNLIVYATIRLAAHDPEAVRAFRDQIQAWPEVLECYILLGEIDVLVKIAVADIKCYEEFFFQKLSQLSVVREVNSSVVVSNIKNTASLPLTFIGQP
ncbi:Lrp/AsnC family transcriptional regulator [Sphingosinicella rhizophila]|uniref:Lrp/AsnC family transcriptional regulator n=1 Tax=Sphingosinicella rhizophila TaxID=3050082 RepID=A0ABU3Q4Y4_9SPHN|nr:Lrp/AsnC family transcriptional regulator [Sphingosinicella sp. GR2756]MDT9598475.1 Lrp/AsnC family transcriptional regulator [Sphingosinicella sp. GR2756]